MNDYEYEKNTTYDEFGQYGIKCKNFELCRSTIPEWWFDCEGHYLCTECHMFFGTWGNQVGL